MADSLSGASAPVVVSSPAASATVSTEAQSLYPAMKGDSWAEYTPAVPAVAPEPALEGTEPPKAGDRERNPDGTFKAKETAEPVAAGEAPTEDVVAAEPEAIVEPEPEPYVVKIPGRVAGDADLEIPFAGLSDEQAEGLARLRNGYMRGEDVRAKTAALDGKLAELNAFETLLSTNPEHVILNALPEQKRIAIATTLIAQYWDQIVPAIQQMDADPVSRVKQASEAQIAIRDQQKDYEQTLARQSATTQVRTALLAQIPEGTDEETAGRFYDDAVNAIRVAEGKGQPVTVSTLPTILAHHVRLYGFAPQANGSASKTPVASPARPVARPVAPTAVTASAPPTSADQAALEQARRGQARLSNVVVAQRRAAGSAPPGAGAAPVRLPPLPKDADIETASAQLKKAGRSWANM